MTNEVEQWIVRLTEARAAGYRAGQERMLTVIKDTASTHLQELEEDPIPTTAYIAFCGFLDRLAALSIEPPPDADNGIDTAPTAPSIRGTKRY